MDTPAPSAAGPLRALFTLASVAAAALGTFAVFTRLNAIDNAPESFTTYGQPLRYLSMVAAGVTLLIAAACFNDPARMVRRAARLAIGALLATLVLWMAPVPFAIQRYALIAGVLFAAAMLALASISTLARPTSNPPTPSPHEQRSHHWRGPLLALAAFTATATGLMLLKLNEIGWAFAID